MQKLKIMSAVRQSQCFADSNLPRTSALVTRYKLEILGNLSPATGAVPLMDRVLAWLAPAFYRDIIQFHAQAGKSLAEMVSKVGIDHLDRDLSALLRQWVADTAAKS